VNFPGACVAAAGTNENVRVCEQSGRSRNPLVYEQIGADNVSVLVKDLDRCRVFNSTRQENAAALEFYSVVICSSNG
jgi:hypothetical protein